MYNSSYIYNCKTAPRAIKQRLQERSAWRRILQTDTVGRGRFLNCQNICHGVHGYPGVLRLPIPFPYVASRLSPLRFSFPPWLPWQIFKLSKNLSRCPRLSRGDTFAYPVPLRCLTVIPFCSRLSETWPPWPPGT